MQAAKRAYASAQVRIGSMYMDGLGVKQDYKEARRWFLVASSKGHPHANYALGLIFEKGLGVKIDLNQAQLYFTLAGKNIGFNQR